LATLGVALLVPAGASADGVKIGSTLQNTQDSGFGTYAEVQLGSATGQQLVSPANGVITSWGVRVSTPETFSILVFHPKSDGSGGFNVPARAAAPGPTDNTDDKTYFFPAPSLPISKGDSIALYNQNGFVPGHNSGSLADVTGGYSIDPNIGDSVGPPGMGTGREVLLQATVKFCKAPDVVRKKVAVAKQLITAADCTPKITKKKAKKKKRKRVIRQKTAAGTTGVPGTTVEIVVGKKKH
jgi:hypothetical protein